MALKKPTQSTADYATNLDLHKLNAGILGKVFGVGESSQSNVAGLTVILGLVIGGLTSAFLLNSGKDNAFEIWKYLAPIVSGALGFLFGKK
jgi:hypothetical protein